MSHRIVLVRRLVVAVGEDRGSRFRLGCERAGPSTNRDRCWLIRVGLANRVEVILLNSAGATSAMAAPAVVTGRVSVVGTGALVVGFLAATIATDVGRARLAKGAAVSALRDWTTLYTVLLAYNTCDTYW